MRDALKQVSNEDEFSENDTGLANIIELDAETTLIQTLSVNSQDFKGTADILGHTCLLKKYENETYTRNFDDFQHSLDVSSCIKAGACFRRPKFTGFCEAFWKGNK